MRYFALILLLVSIQCFAVDYHWKNDINLITASNPAELCELVAQSTLNSTRKYIRNKTLIKVSDTQFRCAFISGADPSQGGTSFNVLLSRLGDTCPADTEYVPETGRCDPPHDECSDKEGQSEPFNKSGNRGDGYYSTVKTATGTLGVTPDSACLGGCTANLNQKCVYSISADRYVCIGTAYFTGSSCVVGDPSVDEDHDPRDLDPTVTEEDEPCVYVQDAEGRLHCESRQFKEEEGQNCGTAGPAGSEERRCFPKQASTHQKTTQTEIEEKPTPDGGTETVKTDVHTETKCTGSPDNCTTTTTTTTTTTKKDGSGTTTKTEVKCTGAKCGDDGKGGGGGGGGGNGSGDGQGDDDVGTGNLPGNDGVPGFGESLSSFTSKVQGAPVFAAVSAISFPTGGSCSMPSANVYMLGSISFDWFCNNSNQLDSLYYVMLGVWAIGAVRVFMEA